MMNMLTSVLYTLELADVISCDRFIGSLRFYKLLINVEYYILLTYNNMYIHCRLFTTY